ncbi:la autoantigen-like [Anticarsia gemmatalis]|uniref:la autoantigen-like n=1 Tax=Anticarsia gemmatalis TaxID=129554 RepID=UPI003F759673
MTEAKEVVADSNGDENNKNAENGIDAETELESAIIRQVEYYFGDVNLSRDKFLRQQVQLDDGWVPLEILIRFNRLAKLSTDVEAIANALIKSTSGILEVSDDTPKKVRRNPEMPVPEMNEERRKELNTRTIYAKGFPKDSLLDDLLKYFAQYEDVENVIMRKYMDRASKKRLFKGSVFATFKTREQAEKFLNGSPKFEDTELIVRWQDDYVQEKQEEYASKREQKEKKVKEREKEVQEKDDFKLPTGTVLHFSEGSETMTREDIKDAITALGTEVAYIDFKVGDKEGWVRLAKENTAKDLAEKLTDGKLKISDKEVVFKILEDEEEKTYLSKTIEEMSKRRRNMKTFQKNKGRKGGNKYHGKKRKQDNGDDGPPKKVQATES